MDFSAIIELVRVVGFPIVVTLYVLIRLEKTMKEVSEKIGNLSEKITEALTYIRAKLENSQGGK